MKERPKFEVRKGRSAAGAAEHRHAGIRALIPRALLLIAFSGFAAASASAQVALLIERGASTYQQAAQGFRNALSPPVEVTQIEIDESGDRLRRELAVKPGRPRASAARTP